MSKGKGNGHFNGGNAPAVQQETSAEHIAILQRRDTVMQLRMSGMILKDIGKQLGVGKGTVLQDIRAVLREMYEDRIDKAEELAQMQLARYEKLLEVWWTKAIDGNIAAAHIVLTTLSRIDAMFGIKQAPQVGEPEMAAVGGNMSEYELARRLAYLLSQGTKNMPMPVNGQTPPAQH